MELIPSLDLLGGRAVRLLKGDFRSARDYGAPADVLDALQIPPGMRVHVVDLEGSRTGRPVETETVRTLAARDVTVQVGGGIRTLDDARRWLDCGARRVVVGTLPAEDPALFEKIVATLGPDVVIPAIDTRDGAIRTRGWEHENETPVRKVLAHCESLKIAEILATEISHDGALRGPSFRLYRELARKTSMRVIASGGVTTHHDVVSLARLGNVSGCVIGRALLENKVSVPQLSARLATPSTIPERVIPCLDVRDGRVVKGVSFTNLRDSGDPVACAMRYEEEGADELVMLDVSATMRDSETALETVRAVANAIFIPLTVGGGVRNLEQFRALLRAGADRVAINTAALERPELIRECSREFGTQAVVLSCDARGSLAAVRSGSQTSDVDVVSWCRKAEELGAGEILLTSVDRDGSGSGFDLELLRSVTSQVAIGVIASGGAGSLDDFRDAIEIGGARAVLAASLFHDQVLRVSDVKRYLAQEGIPVR
jgi:cyclase